MQLREIRAFRYAAYEEMHLETKKGQFNQHTAANRQLGDKQNDRFTADTAEKTGTSERAKQAHDTLIVEVHRSQAHALAIRARAEMRLAEEYDQAQDRGEVVGAHDGAKKRVEGNNAISSAYLGLRRDEIHAARKLRDAERGDYLPWRAASSNLRMASGRLGRSVCFLRQVSRADRLEGWRRTCMGVPTPVDGRPLDFLDAIIDFAMVA